MLFKLNWINEQWENPHASYPVKSIAKKKLPLVQRISCIVLFEKSMW